MLSSRWAMLGILFTARAAMGFQYQVVASSARAFRDNLGFASARSAY